jgi:transglutaminase-like putative cysteine protease
MTITTLHETIFEYDAPIQGTFTEARLWPVTDAGQTCHEFSLTVDPMRPLTESRDYHGNMVLTFNVLPAHRSVVVTGHSVVETHRNPFAQRSPLDEFEIRKAHLDYLGFGGPVEDVAEIEELADAAGLRGAQYPFDAAQTLNELIYERFTYQDGVTDVHTKISEVFASGKGVCQDFAHIFIAVCRAAGLPARYVSGYLVTRRSRSAEGTSASHAWAEVLVPDQGWCGFDPTNNLLANDYYIKIAAGRNYRDVPPTRGIYKGRGVNSRLLVRVHTLVHEDETVAARPRVREDAELVG